MNAQRSGTLVPRGACRALGRAEYWDHGAVERRGGRCIQRPPAAGSPAIAPGPPSARESPPLFCSVRREGFCVRTAHPLLPRASSSDPGWPPGSADCPDGDLVSYSTSVSCPSGSRRARARLECESGVRAIRAVARVHTPSPAGSRLHSAIVCALSARARLADSGTQCKARYPPIYQRSSRVPAAAWRIRVRHAHPPTPLRACHDLDRVRASAQYRPLNLFFFCLEPGS